ncbi:MAG: tRNA pseudouridine(55) synthase TruB [Microlunatus sp.]
MESDNSGIVVVDKPAGWTSHQVVGRCRRLLGTRKVGHAGTLDPMATGVLVVGIGRATRLLGRLALTDKAYAATIRLGQSTVTDDAEGEFTSTLGAVGLDDGAIESAIAALRGAIEQVPSAVSAIKVNGVRSYARVRSGEEVALKSRPVTVSRFDVLGRRDAIADDGTQVVDLEVTVECSSGTYIRALARDLGAALEVGGHLTALRRTRVGPFTLAESQGLDGPELVVTDISGVARRCFAGLELTAEQAHDVTHGRALRSVTLPAEQTAVFAPNGAFLAFYRADPDKPGDAVPAAVFVG